MLFQQGIASALARAPMPGNRAGCHAAPWRPNLLADDATYAIATEWQIAVGAAPLGGLLNGPGDRPFLADQRPTPEREDRLGRPLHTTGINRPISARSIGEP
jgi:hypothetical protein